MFWLTLVLVVLTGTASYVCYLSPILGVRTVQVDGARALRPAEVTTLAQVPMGGPMLRVDTGAIAQRVAAIPRVAAAEVQRSWPSTILITITERVPVVFLRAPDGIKLVDESGYPFATVPVPPIGLPEFVVQKAGPGDAATQAAMQVLHGLPGSLRAELLTISALGPNDVRLVLTAGREIHFGNAEQLDRKIAVAQALLTQPGKVYNVESPEAPTID